MFRKNNNLSDSQEEAPFVSKRGQGYGARSKSVDRAKRSSGDNEDTKLNSINKMSSWRPNASINNIEYEKKKEVDQEIKEQKRRKKRRLRARATLKLSLILASLFALFLILGLSARRVNLELEAADGTDYSKELGQFVSGKVGGGLIGYLHPSFFRYDHIEKEIVEHREDVGYVELRFNLWRLRTEAKVSPNIPLVKWVGSDGGISYVNQDGYIFNPPQELIDLAQPVELGGSGIGVESGSKTLARSDKLNWVVSVIPVLKEQGITPQKVNIDAGSFRSVEILMPGLETRLIFSVDEDPAQSGVAAARSVKFLQKGGEEVLASIGYIDVRTPERVVYR